MSDNEEKAANACKLAPTDSEDKANLCCSFDLDPDAETTVPCHLPIAVMDQKQTV